MRTAKPIWMALTLAAVLGPVAAPARAADKPACDRACLERVVDRYLQALAAHDPRKLPAAKTLAFSENDQPLGLGEGTWSSVTGLGKYRHVFADPSTGQAAVITTVQEAGKGAILDLWLKTDRGRITEVESEIIRDSAGAARYEALGQPPAEWLAPAAPDQKVPREALAAAADKYLSGMQRNDPKGDYSFFDPDCQRLEDGLQTTNMKAPQSVGHTDDTSFSLMTCQQQFQRGGLAFVTAIRDRRYLVVDEERQAVFAFATLDHNGTVRSVRTNTGKDVAIPAYFNVPRTLQAGEAYRMRGGRIWRIEMTLTELPYGMRPASNPAPPQARLPEAKAKPCERDCLGGFVDKVLQAMMDHNPSHAPLAANVRYTENGQVLTAGDGLWGTASAIAIENDGLSTLGRDSSAYRLYFADPATGEAAYFGAVNENGTPGMLAMRIRVAGGRITDIEALVVRREITGARGGTMTLMRPLMLAEFDPKGFSEPEPALLAGGEHWAPAIMAAAADRYFEGMQRSSSAGVPLGPDCVRRDNGVQTTGVAKTPPLDPKVPAFRPFALGCAAQLDSGFFRYVAKVRARRTLVVDEDRGLVLAVALVDHTGQAATLNASAGPVTVPANLRTPSTDLMVAIFKMSDGKITRIETLERPVPYGMSSGWTN